MMTKYANPMLVAAAALLAAATWAAGNMLSNPSFDEPKSAEPPECDQAAVWERYGSWANRHASQGEWEARTGPAMVAYHHFQSDSPNAGWFQDVVNLKSGVPYTFSVWAKWDANCNASNVNIKIEKYAGGGPDYVSHAYSSASVGTNWTKISVQGALPEGVSNARVTIECIQGFHGDCTHAAGSIKFDDASLESGPTP
jgi:hypothetical protein